MDEREQHSARAGANPSRWSDRWLISALAAAGFGLGAYLAAYQLGALSTIWEPFFGNGSERVLHSFVSRLLPVPDALLGAVGYAAEFSTSLLGGATRWETHPWLVMLYGAVVAAIAGTGVLLAIIQLFVIQAGCTLCLTSAALSLLVAWLARREVLASVHVLCGGGR